MYPLRQAKYTLIVGVMVVDLQHDTLSMYMCVHVYVCKNLAGLICDLLLTFDTYPNLACRELRWQCYYIDFLVL